METKSSLQIEILWEYETLFSLGTMADNCDFAFLIATDRACVEITLPLPTWQGIKARGRGISSVSGPARHWLPLQAMAGGCLARRRDMGNCDLLGMDTISLGVTLAFAIECYERGILTNREAVGYATNTRGGSQHDHRLTFRAIPSDDALDQSCRAKYSEHLWVTLKEGCRSHALRGNAGS